MKLVISSTLHTALRRHLEGTFPNEGGGFLIGQRSGERYTVVETRFVENTFETEEQYHRYLIEKGEYQQAEDYADERGLLLMGYFHSHPNHPAIPSEFDRIHAMPKFLYLIVSVRDGQAAESTVWELTDSRERFQPVPLEEVS
jgi:proteasome lid subunit RPN8/RPN11